MANRNIFKGLLNPDYKPPRTAFDLSQRHIFSLKAGALVPVCVIDYVPNDYFEIDMADIIRTMPLNTAAFLRAKLHFDWYAVPYRQLWSRFNQFAVTRIDRTSAAQVGKEIKYQPNVTISKLNFEKNRLPIDGIANKYDSERLLDMLGYGDFRNAPNGDWLTASVSPFRLAAYQKIYHDYYRNPWRDIPQDNEVCTYNFDDLLCSTPSDSLLDGSDTQYSFLIPGTPQNSSNLASRVSELVRLRYRGWKKDIFMGSLPDSQFGAVSAVPVIMNSSSTGSDSGRWSREGGSVLPTSTSVTTNGSGNSVDVSNIKAIHTHPLPNASFDILQLRYFTALQKWKESVMRAGYRTKNQFEAQFGSYDSHDEYDMAIHVGSSFTQIGIDEVVSTSSTTYDSSLQSGNGALGELAGKGIGVGNHSKITFNAGGTYGVLMCIVSVVPEAEYDSSMIDKNVRRFEFDDYFSPMFDNLGMDSIIASDLNANFSNPTNINAVIGYAPRNWEYKTAVDKVHGAFRDGGFFQSWVSQRRDLQAIVNSGSIRIQDYYINPAVLDSLFMAQIGVTGATDWSYNTDQFICNVNFFVNAVRGMSYLGLPQW